jgi:hypothetical protein
MTIVGQRFGHLIILDEVPKIGKNRMVLCRCDCGNEKIHGLRHLKSGAALSCGCTRNVAAAERCRKRATHRQTGSREYRAWRSMKKRCYNITDKNFHNYGGRGISVCVRWLESFECFYADMGVCPDGMSLDRKNNDGNYEPDNCRWVTCKVQSRNTRNNRYITYDGETKTVAEWTEELKVPPWLLYGRMRQGWSDVDIIERPMQYHMKEV